MSFNYDLWAIKEVLIDDDEMAEEPYFVEDYIDIKPNHFRTKDGLLITKEDILFSYSSPGELVRHTAVIPKGFEFDGASIPKKLWNIIGKPTDWKFRKASLVHDFMYGCGYLSRKDADVLFRQILKDEGVWSFKAELMYKAVRVAGILFFNRDGVQLCEDRWKKITMKKKLNRK